MGNRSQQGRSKKKQAEKVSTSDELRAQARIAFNALMKQATNLLSEAMFVKGADGIHLSIVGTRAQAGLSWDECELEGELQSDGTFKLGRKP